MRSQNLNCALIITMFKQSEIDYRFNKFNKTPSNLIITMLHKRSIARSKLIGRIPPILNNMTKETNTN